MKVSNKTYTLAELVQGLDATIKGDASCRIHGAAPIQQSTAGHITFLTNPLYRKHLATTQASAVILTEKDAAECVTNAIICRDPHYLYSQIARYFEQKPAKAVGMVHPSAVVGQDCKIHSSVHIGANAVIGDRVTLGANVVIHPGCVIGDDVSIGEGSELDAKVTVYYGVTIGKRAHILSGVVIGSDGFGFANYQRRWHKVPQLGSVVIGNDVGIGSNTTIDRGAMGDTIIGDGVKLDNLIQVAHNVVIGDHTIIAGCVAIAGSTVIGKHCMVGGGTCFAGHITVADQVMLTGMTSVTKSIAEPGIYSSGIVGAVPNEEFRKNNARFYRLEKLMQRVKALEALNHPIESEDL